MLNGNTCILIHLKNLDLSSMHSWLWMNERQLCTGNWHDELPWISTTAFLGRLCHSSSLIWREHWWILTAFQNFLSITKLLFNRTKRQRLFKMRQNLKSYYRSPEGGRLFDMKVVSSYVFLRPIISIKKPANHAAAISHKHWCDTALEKLACLRKGGLPNVIESASWKAMQKSKQWFCQILNYEYTR